MKKSHEVKRSLFLSSLQAQVVCALSAVVLLLIFCTIAYSAEDPDSISFPLSLCALYLSSMIGGIAAVRLSGDGIVSGLLSGLVTALLVWLLSLLPLPESGVGFPVSFLYTGMVIPASAIGAALGHKRKERPGMKGKLKKNIR
ncbi:MAG: TIGR04086 family membrane protein [Clostridia bacterium]|nr:TIGR04086 family membrane protein [Clostridia bacterium]